MQQTPTISPLINAIMMNVDNHQQGAKNPCHWPHSAVYAVEYTVRDKQFPSVDHGTTTTYFDTIEEFQAWEVEKLEWIRGTDYDFSLSGTKYEWDLGPNVVGHVYL